LVARGRRRWGRDVGRFAALPEQQEAGVERCTDRATRKNSKRHPGSQSRERGLTWTSLAGMISTIAKTGVPAAVASASVSRRCTQNGEYPVPRRRSTALRRQHLHRLQSLRVGLRRSQRYAADTRGSAASAPNDSTIHRNIIKLYNRRMLACLFREAAVHALSHPACALGVLPALHKDPRRASELDRRGMHRLPLLHDHLSLHCPFQWQVTTAGDKCELCSTRWRRLKPGCTTSVHRRVILSRTVLLEEANTIKKIRQVLPGTRTRSTTATQSIYLSRVAFGKLDCLNWDDRCRQDSALAEALSYFALPALYMSLCR